MLDARAVAERDPRRRPELASTRSCARRSRTSSATPSSSSSRADEHGAPRRLRVIAGVAGGRRSSRRAAADPPDHRPGARGAVLRARPATVVRAASVLDLYAGSGALGDRGAVPRRGPRACSSTRPRRGRRRVRATSRRPGSRTAPVCASQPVDAFLAGAAPAEAPFDLVLARPALRRPSGERRARSLERARRRRLARAGRAGRRRAAARGDARPALAGDVATTWERGYGDTLVTIVASDRTQRPDSDGGPSTWPPPCARARSTR